MASGGATTLVRTASPRYLASVSGNDATPFRLENRRPHGPPRVGFLLEPQLPMGGKAPKQAITGISYHSQAGACYIPAIPDNLP